jgi:hypothetical protein
MAYSRRQLLANAAIAASGSHLMPLINRYRGLCLAARDVSFGDQSRCGS